MEVKAFLCMLSPRVTAFRRVLAETQDAAFAIPAFRFAMSSRHSLLGLAIHREERESQKDVDLRARSTHGYATECRPGFLVAIIVFEAAPLRPINVTPSWPTRSRRSDPIKASSIILGSWENISAC